ncbi:hypothetical protein ACLRAJ_08405 [Bordetella avium]|uniref:hypothetical protein n=1 Tax=Bordetella avium TaxID=521 RepID=UPI0039FDD87A
MNKSAFSLVSSPVNWNRSFLADQAHQFLRVEQENGATLSGPDDNKLLERCTAYLMNLCNCSKVTAATQAAQAIAELASKHSSVSFDMDRSTAFALFVVDHSSNVTRVISAAELVQLLRQAEATNAHAPATRAA